MNIILFRVKFLQSPYSFYGILYPLSSFFLLRLNVQNLVFLFNMIPCKVIVIVFLCCNLPLTFTLNNKFFAFDISKISNSSQLSTSIVVNYSLCDSSEIRIIDQFSRSISTAVPTRQINLTTYQQYSELTQEPVATNLIAVVFKLSSIVSIQECNNILNKIKKISDETTYAMKLLVLLSNNIDSSHFETLQNMLTLKVTYIEILEIVLEPLQRNQKMFFHSEKNYQYKRHWCDNPFISSTYKSSNILGKHTNWFAGGKNSNFNGHSIIVGSMNDSHSGILYDSHSKTTYLHGVNAEDINFLFLKIFNASIQVRTPETQHRDSWKQIFQEVANGTIDIIGSLSTHYQLIKRNETKLSITESTKLHDDSIITKPTKLITFYAVTSTVYVNKFKVRCEFFRALSSIVGISVVFFLTSYLLKFNVQNWKPLIVIGILLCFNTAKNYKRTSETALYMCCLIIGAIFSVLIFFDTTKFYLHSKTEIRFKNFTDLENHNFQTQISRGWLERHFPDGYSKKFNKNYKIIDSRLYCIQNLLTYRNVTCLLSGDEYEALKLFITSKQLPMITLHKKLSYYTGPIGYPVTPYSQYYHKISNTYWSLNEYGISKQNFKIGMLKLLKETYCKNIERAKPEENSKFEMKLFWYLPIGYSFATVVLIIECCIGYKKKNRRKFNRALKISIRSQNTILL